MDYQENLNNLLKIVRYKKDQNKITLKFNDEYKLFPFQTREPNRPKFDSGFKKIISEFSRINSSEDIGKEFNNENLIKEILSNDKIDITEEDYPYLEALIKDYLIDKDNELKIVHPCLYRYVSKTQDESNKGETDIAQFFNDVFFDDINIKEYFNSKDYENSAYTIISHLVIDNLPELKKKTIPPIYINKLEYVTKVFKDDINFALEHEDFLNKNIENIFWYYYFFYTTQLSLKIFNEENTLDKCEEMYYLIETEIASKNRKTVENGYKRIRNNNKSLLYKVYTLEYINKLLGTQGKIRPELINYFNQLDKKEQNEIIEILKQFIEIYNKTTENYEAVPYDDFENLMIYFYKKLLEIKDQSPNSRFGSYFEDIGKKYFLKRGGRYGNILSLSQEMLLTITTLCVKEEKIKLKDLFERYEERGIYFDNTSKSEVVNLLNKLNYIDKKSDSGEAQYVRRLL